MHAEVDAARGGGRSYLTGQNVHRPAFMASVDAFHRIKGAHQPGPWPAILTLRGLDEVVLHVRRATP